MTRRKQWLCVVRWMDGSATPRFFNGFLVACGWAWLQGFNPKAWDIKIQRKSRYSYVFEGD